MTVAMTPPIGAHAPVSRLWAPAPEAPVPQAMPLHVQPLQGTPLQTAAPDFSQLLSGAIDKVSTNVVNADNMVRSFVLDDSVPVHQVTFALEQARLSMELMLQVRGRMVEAYQQLMNMQL